MTFSRRRFISGLTAVSCAAMFRNSAGLAAALQDPCDTATFDLRYKRTKNPGQLSISFLGTFAIFVTQSNIVAYTPSVNDDQGHPMHNYWLAQPVGPDGLKSKHLYDLAGNNAPFAGIDSKGGQRPTFVTRQPGAINAIDSDVNLVVTAKLKTTPLHTIILPLPNDVLLAGWSQKDTDRIFANQQINDFCFLARDHVFVYDASRFNAANLTYNGTTVDAGTSLSLRFLSEPISDNQVVQECESSKHIERAMQALANILGMGDDDLAINLSYCNQQQDLGLARGTLSGPANLHHQSRGLDGGPGVISASRFPACQSALIDAP